jgi:tetratricopeptide (TPR) repeat protein
VICLEQLGDIGDQLGEYELAFKYHNQGLSLIREIGERNWESGFLMDLGISFYHLGRHEMAAQNIQQALSIAHETKNRLAQNRALTFQGHALRDLNHLDQAAHSYQQALDLALEMGLHHFVKQAQTGLACIALAHGNLGDAQAPLDEILHYLETTSLSTMDEIFWMYLTCYRILQAIPYGHDGADPRAGAILQAGHSLLQQIAARIGDETIRASFLQNVRSNREIVQAWKSLRVS